MSAFTEKVGKRGDPFAARRRAMECGECGQIVEAAEYHPYLYCELFKLGHRDQTAYLRYYGFTRAAAPPEGSQASAMPDLQS